MNAIATPPASRFSRLRIAVFVALWAVVSAVALLTPGCYGRNCEGGYSFFGVDAGDGNMVSEDLWESSPIDGEWLWFPRQHVIIFDLRALGGRTPFLPEAFLSGNPRPNKNGASSVQGAGNLAEFFNVGPNHIEVKNDSCSDYYLRVALVLPPLAPALPTDDAATPDAATSDASTDADITDAGVSDAEAGD